MTESELRKRYFETQHFASHFDKDLTEDEEKELAAIFVEIGIRGGLWSDELSMGELLSSEVV